MNRALRLLGISLVTASFLIDAIPWEATTLASGHRTDNRRVHPTRKISATDIAMTLNCR